MKFQRSRTNISESGTKLSFWDMSCNRDKDPWQVDLKLDGQPTEFKIDTGADVTVIPEATYSNLVPRPPLQSTTAVLQGPGGKIACICEITAILSYKLVDYSVRIFVVREKV